MRAGGGSRTESGVGPKPPPVCYGDGQANR